MRRWAITLNLLVWLVGRAPAQDGMAPNTLERVKSATVFIRSPAPAVDGRPARTTGSGFLVHRRGDSGYVVTNRHVVAHAAGPGAVSVVFDSGTERERILAADVVVTDADNDLALLRVAAADLPRPLILAPAAPRETATVYLFGFPFGEALALDERNPNVTVGRATISSLRHDAHGRLARVQVSGDINPGNSGGPLVDERGAVVAVALARVSGTQIGVAVPHAAVAALLGAQVTRVVFEPVTAPGEALRFEVAVHVVDPLGQVRGVALLTTPAAALATELEQLPADEPAAPGMDECRLTLEGPLARGELRLPAGEAAAPYVFQVRYAVSGGPPRYTAPQEFQPGQPVSTAPSAAAAAAPTSIPATQPSAPVPPPAAPDTDWLGGPQQRQRQQAHAAGAPYETGTALAGKPRAVADAQFTPLNVAAADVVGMAWAEDAHVVLLERAGVLRRIEVSSLVERRQFLLSQPCSGLTRSAAGLVVAVGGGELWVFDEATLAPRRKIAVPNLEAACGAPGTPLVVARADGDALHLIDAAAGRITRTLRWPALAAETPVRAATPRAAPGGLEHFALAAHGQALLVAAGGAVHRFRIANDALLYEERGPVLGDISGLALSEDARYVAVTGPAAAGVPAHAASPGGGVYVYKLTDLRVPVLELTAVNAPAAFAFDRAGGRVYAGTRDAALATFSAAGTAGTVYETRRGEGGAVSALLVHPDGGRVFCLTDEELLWVEWPG